MLNNRKEIVDRIDDFVVELEDVVADAYQLLHQLQQFQTEVAEATTSAETDEKGLLVSNPFRF